MNAAVSSSIVVRSGRVTQVGGWPAPRRSVGIGHALGRAEPGDCAPDCLGFLDFALLFLVALCVSTSRCSLVAMGGH